MTSSSGKFTGEAALVCPYCGLNYAAGAKFCGDCGITLAASATGQKETTGQKKLCPLCGRTLPLYARFCPEDGEKVLLVDENNARVADVVANAGRMAFASDVASKRNERTSWRNTGRIEAEPLGGGEFLINQEGLIGKTIGDKYRIDTLLGEGGMAQVFRATHLSLERPVVIKLMHSSLPSMDTALKRFEIESKVTAKLDHPNIVSVFDVGFVSGRRPYLVMEYIEGESLRDKLEREGSMEPEQAARALIQICLGLQEAHGQGIVHRDLKPENIMLRDRADRPDWVKIVDFGIAHLKQGGQRLTKTGIAIGTVDYMSPEYLSDKPIDHRADIYALGVILYELICDRCPFQAETAEAVMAKHLWSIPNPVSHYRPDLIPDGPFDRIGLKALEKEPDSRYQSVADLRQDLEVALRELGC